MQGLDPGILTKAATRDNLQQRLQVWDADQRLLLQEIWDGTLLPTIRGLGDECKLVLGDTFILGGCLGACSANTSALPQTDDKLGFWSTASGSAALCLSGLHASMQIRRHAHTEDQCMFACASPVGPYDNNTEVYVVQLC